MSISLRDRFGMPPIDVIYARTKEHLDIKHGLTRKITEAIGDDVRLVSPSKAPVSMATRATKEDIECGDKYGRKRVTASVFDPYLSYIMTAWYCPPGGMVLDPFAGGPIRAVAADMCGASYYGVDICEEQVSYDRRIVDMCGVPSSFVCADSSTPDAWGDVVGDFLITCPPYYDVERYGGPDGDLSMMSHDAFEDSYRECLTRCVEHLSRPSFAVIVVGDCRDNDGTIRCLDNVTMSIMNDLGAVLYNRAVLVPPIGSGSLRCVYPFERSGKITRSHQHVLVFYLGDCETSPSEFWKQIHPDGVNITPPMEAFSTSHVGRYLEEHHDKR